MKFKPSKSEVNAWLATEKDQTPAINYLKETIARLNRATSYDVPEAKAEDITEQIVDTSENTLQHAESLPAAFPENDESYENAFRELMSQKAGIRDKPLGDMLDRYLKAVTRKHHAWLWQQNFPDASLQDKDKMWFDLEQADEEAAALTQELSERIEELLHEKMVKSEYCLPAAGFPAV
jgi:hypothetical protein